MNTVPMMLTEYRQRARVKRLLRQDGSPLKRFLKRTVIVLALIMFAGMTFNKTKDYLDRAERVKADPTATMAAAKPTPKPTIDKSEKMQKQRQAFIEKLIGRRVLTKVDTPGSLPRAHVGPVFYTLDFDTKQSFINVVYAYYFDGSDDYDILRVMDGRTNKAVGTFTTSGLSLD